MKMRSLILTALIAVLVLAAAIWVSSSRAPTASSANTGPLAPGLSALLDQITQVRIRSAGNEVIATLEQGEDGWGLREKNDYPVDLDRLRNLLSALATAQRVEAKTAMAERYWQLGVEDVALDDARGVAVDIVTPKARYAFIIGDNPVRGSGTYVRADGDAQTWLVDQSIAVERKPANWLVKEIIDVGANRVQRVSVTPAEGAAFAIERAADDAASDYRLEGVPPGREVAEDYQREALAGLLSGLGFEDVYPVAEYAVPEQTRVTLFALDDGRRVRIESWQDDGRTYARFDMTLDEDAATAWLARPLAQAGDSASKTREAVTDGSDDETAVPASAARTVTRADLDSRVRAFQRARQDWVYQLPAYKAANLNKDLEAYLKPKE